MTQSDKKGIFYKKQGTDWERAYQTIKHDRYSSILRRLMPMWELGINTVEGYHRQIRKLTKTKGVFSSDESLLKLVYPAYRNIKKKWTMPLANWSLIAQQLCIRFEDRFKIL